MLTNADLALFTPPPRILLLALAPRALSIALTPRDLPTLLLPTSDAASPCSLPPPRKTSANGGRVWCPECSGESERGGDGCSRAMQACVLRCVLVVVHVGVCMCSCVYVYLMCVRKRWHAGDSSRTRHDTDTCASTRKKRPDTAPRTVRVPCTVCPRNGVTVVDVYAAVCGVIRPFCPRIVLDVPESVGAL